jgi:hypothetical protein
MKRSILKALACVTHIKIFQDQGWQVALFGQPALSEDGWIINLPADEFFASDYSSLPAESLLEVDFVLERVPMKDPLPQLIGSDVEGYSWRARAPRLKKRKYKMPALFRDLAIECERDGCNALALRFMQKALELQPEGALLREKVDQYVAALQS